MLVFWGEVNTRTDLDRGEFFCPECGCNRVYLDQQIIRKSFVFFFTVSSSVLGEVMQCDTCRTDFDEATVLANPPVEEREGVLAECPACGHALNEGEEECSECGLFLGGTG